MPLACRLVPTEVPTVFVGGSGVSSLFFPRETDATLPSSSVPSAGPSLIQMCAPLFLGLPFLETGVPLPRLAGLVPGVRLAEAASGVEGSACSSSAREGLTSSGWSSMVSPPLDGAAEGSRDAAMGEWLDNSALLVPHSCRM